VNEKIIELKDRLISLKGALDKAIPNDEAFTTQGGWSAPSVSWADLDAAVEDVIAVIDRRGDGSDPLDTDAADKIEKIITRLKFLEDSTVPNIWGNTAAGVQAFLLTMFMVRRDLEIFLKTDPRHQITEDLNAIRRRVRAANATLNSLEPNLTQVSSMVSDIQKAYVAADRLPTDLEALTEQRSQIAKLGQEAAKDHGRAQIAREKSEELQAALKVISDEAKGVLENCQSAYSAATSVGLARAFSERSKSLTFAMGLWVFGLIVALGVAGFLGGSRLESLSQLLGGEQAQTGPIVLSIAMSVLSIGAPIWFAWLATKQVGQQFRLAEDYAFKASISRAYEGYRREAARIDVDLEARLLASALDRLDEEPLRLVDSATHSSPLQEALSSEVVKQAFQQIPNFADQVRGLAATAVSGAAGALSMKRPKPAVVPDADDDKESEA